MELIPFSASGIGLTPGPAVYPEAGVEPPAKKAASDGVNDRDRLTEGQQRSDNPPALQGRRRGGRGLAEPQTGAPPGFQGILSLVTDPLTAGPDSVTLDQEMRVKRIPPRSRSAGPWPEPDRRVRSDEGSGQRTPTMSHALGTQGLDALIEVGTAVNASLDLDEVPETVMRVTNDVMAVEASSLVLIDEDTGDLLFHVARGEKAEGLKPIRLEPGRGIVGQVIQSAASVLVNDVGSDPRFCGDIDDEIGFRTRAILCVPIVSKDRLWGAVEVLNKADGSDFDEPDLRLCEALAAQAAVAIENAVLHRRIVASERLAAVGQTVAGMARCIKNVLNGMKGGAFVVDAGMRKNNPAKVTTGWQMVKKNSAFLEELVLDMLTYSKEREPEYATVEVGELILTVRDLVGPSAAANGIEVSCEESPFLSTPVSVDPRGIRRCLLNLVGNAVDACAGRPRGAVVLAALPMGEDWFEVRIRSLCRTAQRSENSPHPGRHVDRSRTDERHELLGQGHERLLRQRTGCLHRETDRAGGAARNRHRAAEPLT